VRIERLLRASGFEMTTDLRRLLKASVGGRNRNYRWILAGPALFLRWSLDLVEPSFLLGIESDGESYDGLDVTLSIRDPRTFEEVGFGGYDGSGDKF
jgi:hypothetical protein